MKVISGGGGIDADGNWYTLRAVEREVPDDWIPKLKAAFKTVPAPHDSAVMFVHPDILDALRDAK